MNTADTNGHPLAADLLVGAAAIARFVLGGDSPEECRRIYWLAANGSLPTFKMGPRILAARKSALLKLGAA
jgi:hypothetical protein